MDNKIIPLQEFFEAYKECRKRKRNTANALKFEIDYMKNLIDLYEDVKRKRYKIGTSITFIVTRPKYREVFAADFRDRIIHHIIMKRLEPLFEKDFIVDNYSCRKGKGTLYGIERLADKIKQISNNYTEDCWIGKFDIMGFFMSISKPILWEKLKTYINEKYKKEDKEYLLYLTKKVVLNSPQENCIRKSPIKLWDNLPKNKSLFTCDPNCGLPIGNLTSQCFANFYLNEFDHWMSKTFSGFYGRYVDDFYVLAKTKEEILKRIETIKNFLKNNLGLTLHPKKQYIQRYDKGVKFIGSVVKKSKINIGTTCLGGLYDTIKFYNKETPTLEGAEKLYQTLNSYFGFLSKHDSYYKRRKIWFKLNLSWKKYLSINRTYQKVYIKSEYNKYRILKQNLKQNTNHERYFN